MCFSWDNSQMHCYCSNSLYQTNFRSYWTVFIWKLIMIKKCDLTFSLKESWDIDGPTYSPDKIMFVLSCGDQEYVCVDSTLNPKPKENPKSGCFSNCACLPWMTHKHTPSLLDVRLHKFLELLTSHTSNCLYILSEW